MICHVIINDFEISQRMLYVLDDSDFKIQQSRWHETDDLLVALQSNEMFAGKLHWCDLTIKHFHVMIVNMLKIMSNMDDTVRADKSSAPVTRLAFFLCSMISVLQEGNGSTIELMRVNRVSTDDVLYDFTASLDVKIDRSIPRTTTGFKVVINNDF